MPDAAPEVTLIDVSTLAPVSLLVLEVKPSHVASASLPALVLVRLPCLSKYSLALSSAAVILPSWEILTFCCLPPMVTVA